MLNLFTDDARRNPFAIYTQLRNSAPVFRAPPPFQMWMVLDYENAKRVVSDHQSFSSAVPAPRNWFIFMDPPQHSKLRALISRAFTPTAISDLEPHIKSISRELLDKALSRGELDLAEDYAVPLPMRVIAELIGIPVSEWSSFKRWSDTILKLSYTLRGVTSEEESARTTQEFRTVTAEMSNYLAEMSKARTSGQHNDLLGRLLAAEVDGEKLSHEEILGFFQLLLVAGQETTANLINNAIICFLEYPESLEKIRRDRASLPKAIEEVLRYRSPVQWLMRTPKAPVVLAGSTINPGELVLVVLGSANRDPKKFADADKFDISRDPNPHIAFGHGIHACLGAALARMEARIALNDLLTRMETFEFASEVPWPPRKALHVHGPASLPLRFNPMVTKLS